MRSVVRLLVVACVLAGCGKRLTAVEATQVDHRRRLDVQNAQISASEERARRAAAEARRQECRSASARVRAEIDRLDADCERTIAEAARCESAAQRHQSHATVAGCVAGLGAALLTSGAATGLAVVGCGGGYLYGSATKASCPEVRCREAREARLARAMSAAKLDALPICSAAVELVVQQRAVGGMRISSLDAGWPAEQAGLQVGDVIVMTEGELLTDETTFGRLRDEHGAISMCVVRGEHLLCVEVQAQPDLDGQLYVGMRNEWIPAVPFVGYAVVGTDPDRPTGLQVDDVVFGFDDRQLLAPELLDQLLEAGGAHRLRVLRADRVVEVAIDGGEWDDADVPAGVDEEW